MTQFTTEGLSRRGFSRAAEDDEEAKVVQWADLVVTN